MNYPVCLEFQVLVKFNVAFPINISPLAFYYLHRLLDVPRTELESFLLPVHSAQLTLGFNSDPSAVEAVPSPTTVMNPHVFISSLLIVLSIIFLQLAVVARTHIWG